ncbi:uncharacterized protein DUF4163 [Sphingobacterium allocomposti]|jgi:hypothetical protein|uniref:Uncharacterized protein DUF4163 n=1 Tax=Sphingobacterium allocomposti TaxID=415956 RepID=A0A5S5DKS6_9SPHI|nr:DUF3298 and DUF4163 domain-containing protein [Sphingobacterium composti Yoo et al. 2007 non Ten et al. 2007]TYP96521.1 uncharacterized protein DUF4163 [Sphingobacterium composti Yoo et al. 2007 non Ten et al. 2007]HLS94641.1 DUF3298 domain-containing protein [Sphingobacterium sp.]
MKRSNLYSFLVVLTSTLWSCVTENRSTQQQADQGQSSTSVTDTLAYEITYFKDFSPYFSGTDTQIDSTIFSARYPVFKHDVDSLVRKAIFVDGESDVRQVAESFIGGFNEYAEEQIQSGNQPSQVWFRHQDCHVVLNIPGYLSLCNNIVEYTGGAHGIELMLWSNFDISERKQLALADVVQDTSALLSVAEKHFRQQEQLSDTASYDGAYFFDNNAFSLAENFGLTKEGILFHYNPYEIKSYAEGPTTLIIPFGEIDNILTEKGKDIKSKISAKK